MEQNPSWENNSHSASQKIPRPLWNENVRYHVHTSPPLVPILSQINRVHNLSPYSPSIHCNIIFASTPRSSAWSLPFRFPKQNVPGISHLYNACYMFCSFHPPFFTTLIEYGGAYKLRSSSLCSLLQPPATPSLLGPNVFNGLFWCEVT